MTQNELVTTIKKEAAKNKTFEDIAHLWANRKRARNVVTLYALKQRMKKEGFQHDSAEYVAVLKRLAELGFGRLDTNGQGRIRALKDIKISLQSLGKVAVGEEKHLKTFKPRNRYTTMTAPQPAPIPSPKKPAETSGLTVALVVTVRGKPVTMQIPKSFTGDDFKDLISKFQESNA